MPAMAKLRSWPAPASALFSSRTVLAFAKGETLQSDVKEHAFRVVHDRVSDELEITCPYGGARRFDSLPNEGRIVLVHCELVDISPICLRAIHDAILATKVHGSVSAAERSAVTAVTCE